MRLIDAEKLEAKLHEKLCNPRNRGQSAGIAAAIHLVQKQPTIQPNRGEWIAHKGAHGKNYTTCSNCNSEIALKLKDGSIKRLDMTNTNFCPNCGADMRGEE